MECTFLYIVLFSFYKNITSIILNVKTHIIQYDKNVLNFLLLYQQTPTRFVCYIWKKQWPNYKVAAINKTEKSVHVCIIYVYICIIYLHISNNKPSHLISIWNHPIVTTKAPTFVFVYVLYLKKYLKFMYANRCEECGIRITGLELQCDSPLEL